MTFQSPKSNAILSANDENIPFNIDIVTDAERQTIVVSLINIFHMWHGATSIGQTGNTRHNRRCYHRTITGRAGAIANHIINDKLKRDVELANYGWKMTAGIIKEMLF